MPDLNVARPVSPARAWFAVFVLMLAYLLAMLDRTILYLMVEPLQRDLHITDTEVGVLNGFAFVLFYALVGFPIGRLADRLSRRRIIAVGIVLWSLMTAVSGLARTFWHLLLARMGVGIGEAALNPAAYSLLADLFPKERLGRALGVFSSGAMMGSGLAFVCGGLVMQWVGTRPEVMLPLVGTVRSWQVAFFVVGIPGLLVAALLLLIPEPRHAMALRAPAAPLSELLRFLRAAWLPLLLYVAAYGAQTTSTYSTMSWAPTLLIRKHELATSAVGGVMGIVVGVFGLGGFLCGGWLADRFIRDGHADGHLRVGVIAAALFAPFGLVATTSDALAPTVASLCGVVFAASMPTAAGMAGLQLMTPPPLRAQVTAIFMLLVNLIGMGIGSFSVGALNDHVFGSKSAIDLSLLTVYCIVAPAMGASFWYGRRHVAHWIQRLERGTGY